MRLLPKSNSTKPLRRQNNPIKPAEIICFNSSRSDTSR